MNPKIQLDADAEFCAFSVCVLSPGSVCVSMTVVAAGAGLVTSTGKAVGSGVVLSTFCVLFAGGGTKWCVGAGVDGFEVGFVVAFGVGAIVFTGVGPGGDVGQCPKSGSIGFVQSAWAMPGANVTSATMATTSKRA